MRSAPATIASRWRARPAREAVEGRWETASVNVPLRQTHAGLELPPSLTVPRHHARARAERSRAAAVQFLDGSADALDLAADLSPQLRAQQLLARANLSQRLVVPHQLVIERDARAYNEPWAP